MRLASGSYTGSVASRMLLADDLDYRKIAIVPLLWYALLWGSPKNPWFFGGSQTDLLL